MQLGLGIDTGGTFTDVALYDFNTNKVIDSAKAPTRKENLQKGIEEALDQLDGNLFQKVQFVSLSTTLATNACVENKGANATLILIGSHPKVVEQYGKEYGLPDADQIILLDGTVNDNGEAVKEPDWEYLKQRLKAFDPFTDCYAVVQTWSMLNPVFEQKAEAVIAEQCGKPVVCGHELSGKLNVLKRASAALLNAKLIPVIRDFMDNVLQGLKSKGIHAPVVIVRGDGSVMSLDFALKRPVETLLSGPAASMHGGVYLSNHKNQIIVDIGGTTSDIALIKDGYPSLLEDGAVVGEWKTAIASVDMTTCAMGGDSEIKITKDKEITVGPQRVIPLCALAAQYPKVEERLEELTQMRPLHTRPLPVFYVYTGKKGNRLSEKDEAVLEALKEGPLDITKLCEKIDQSIYSFNATELENKGLIMKSSLTPTDIMHIQGDFTRWNVRASLLAVQVLSNQFGIDKNRICKETYRKVVLKIYGTIVKMLLEKNRPGIAKTFDTPFFDRLLEYSTFEDDLLKASFYTSYVLCGLGAPAFIFIPLVGRLLNTTTYIPEYASVANAIGAVTGKVISIEEGMVLPRYENHALIGYTVRTRKGSTFFKELEDAVSYAAKTLEEDAVSNALHRGAVEVQSIVEIDENRAEILSAEESDENSLLVDIRILARATGGYRI